MSWFVRAGVVLAIAAVTFGLLSHYGIAYTFQRVTPEQTGLAVKKLDTESTIDSDTDTKSSIQNEVKRVCVIVDVQKAYTNFTLPENDNAVNNVKKILTDENFCDLKVFTMDVLDGIHKVEGPHKGEKVHGWFTSPDLVDSLTRLNKSPEWYYTKQVDDWMSVDEKTPKEYKTGGNTIITSEASRSGCASQKISTWSSQDAFSVSLEIEKKSADKPVGRDHLVNRLARAGYTPQNTHLYVVGVQANRCVFKGSMHARHLGFAVTVIQDATYGGEHQKWTPFVCQKGSFKKCLPEYQQKLQTSKEKNCRTPPHENCVVPPSECNGCDSDELNAWYEGIYLSFASRGGPALSKLKDYYRTAGITAATTDGVLEQKGLAVKKQGTESTIDSDTDTKSSIQNEKFEKCAFWTGGRLLDTGAMQMDDMTTIIKVDPHLNQDNVNNHKWDLLSREYASRCDGDVTMYVGLPVTLTMNVHPGETFKKSIFFKEELPQLVQKSRKMKMFGVYGFTAIAGDDENDNVLNDHDAKKSLERMFADKKELCEISISDTSTVATVGDEILKCYNEFIATWEHECDARECKLSYDNIAKPSILSSVDSRPWLTGREKIDVATKCVQQWNSDNLDDAEYRYGMGEIKPSMTISGSYPFGVFPAIHFDGDAQKKIHAMVQKCKGNDGLENVIKCIQIEIRFTFSSISYEDVETQLGKWDKEGNRPYKLNDLLSNQIGDCRAHAYTMGFAMQQLKEERKDFGISDVFFMYVSAPTITPVNKSKPDYGDHAIVAYTTSGSSAREMSPDPSWEQLQGWQTGSMTSTKFLEAVILDPYFPMFNGVSAYIPVSGTCESQPQCAIAFGLDRKLLADFNVFKEAKGDQRWDQYTKTLSDTSHICTRKDVIPPMRRRV
jgi:nicotinamidase-related amidase